MRAIRRRVGDVSREGVSVVRPRPDGVRTWFVREVTDEGLMPYLATLRAEPNWSVADGMGLQAGI